MTGVHPLEDIKVVSLEPAVARSELRALAAKLPSHVSIFLGGRGARRAVGRSQTRIRVLDDLDQLDVYLSAGD